MVRPINLMAQFTTSHNVTNKGFHREINSVAKRIHPTSETILKLGTQMAVPTTREQRQAYWDQYDIEKGTKKDRFGLTVKTPGLGSVK